MDKCCLSIRFFFLSGIWLLLAGCQGNALSYDDLMERPLMLKKEAERCQMHGVFSDAHCQTVMRAAEDFTDLLNAQQANPEKFGERILVAEVACVEARQAVAAAQRDVNALKRQSAEQQAAEEKLIQAQKQQAVARHAVKVMLAVVGLSGPE